MTSESEVDWKIAPLRNQLIAQGQEVGQVAVVGDGHAAALKVGEHRLAVAQEAAAGGGIAGVADRRGAGQAMDEIRSPGKGVADVAQVALGVKALTVEGGDAAGLLPAMLQGVQAQRHDGRGVRNAEDAEDAALEPGARNRACRFLQPHLHSAHRPDVSREADLAEHHAVLRQGRLEAEDTSAAAAARSAAGSLILRPPATFK
jgi:hypothetical protein